jgi:hypothetical protein
MIPDQAQPQTQPILPQQIADLVDRYGLQWVDQYNQMLILTVQAIQALHLAFDGKFSR